MTQQQVYFLPSPGVIAALSDNQIDLADALRRAGIQATVEYRDDPTTDPASRTREPVTAIVLAAGVSAVFFAQAISRIIQQMQDKPVLTKTVALQAIRDADGSVAKHPDGSPILFWAEQETLTAPPERNPALTADLSLPFGIKISLETEADRK